MIILKIVAHTYIDETPLYNSIIYFIVHLSLAFSFFTSIKHFTSKIRISKNKIIDFFDDISYYVFITHYSFIVGPVSLLNITNNYYINVLIIIVVSFVTAKILKIITDKINLFLSTNKKSKT